MRRIRISFCLALSLVAVEAGHDEFQSIVERAVQMQQAGEDVGAADAYRRALRVKPDDVATHVNLGVVLSHLGRFDESIAEYQAAERLLPGDDRITLNIALAYEKSGRIEEARDRFDTLHQAKPADRKLLMLLADSELQLGHEQRVVELLSSAAKVDETDLASAYMLGIALLRTGQIEKGQLMLDRILRNGDTVEARFLLGTRMFESGDYPAAVKQLASAMEMNPQLPQLASFYGRALLNTGDAAAAEQAFRESLQTNQADYDAALGLAQILVARKQYQQALPLAQRAAQLRTEAADAKLVLAACLAGKRQFSLAQPYAEQATKAMPTSVEAHEALSAIYAGLQRSTDAARETKTAQSLASASDPGPKLHELAPDFALADAVSGKPVRLRDLLNDRPVVLVFGSYSCPNFRDTANDLKHLYSAYAVKANFLLVYVREAHAGGDWQSTRNLRADISLPPVANYGEKLEHALLCSRNLHLPFRAVVDGMDGAVEHMYNAWPSRAFVIKRNGQISYSSRLTELDFQPQAMEAALRQSVR